MPIITDTDTDVGITNTEKYQIPTKKYRKYRGVGIIDPSYLIFTMTVIFFAVQLYRGR